LVCFAGVVREGAAVEDGKGGGGDGDDLCAISCLQGFETLDEILGG